MAAPLSHNISLSAGAGLWKYYPLRDTLAQFGWNASYTQRQSWPDLLAPGPTTDIGAGALYYRTRTQAQIALSFIGTSAVLCIQPNSASYSLTVNDVVLEVGARIVPNDPACDERGQAIAVLAFAESEARPHYIALDVWGSVEQDHEFMFYGGTVTIQVEATSNTDTVAETIVDDQQPGWNLSSSEGGITNWTPQTVTDAYDQTYVTTCDYYANQTAGLSFSGASAVVLYGTVDRDTHDYTVSLSSPGSDSPEIFNGDVSASGWQLGSTPLFLATGLDYDQNYTIQVMNYGPENCTSTVGTRHCCTNLDAVQLIRSSGRAHPVVLVPTPPQQTPTPTATAPAPAPGHRMTLALLVGIGVIGVVTFLLCVLLGFWILRRVRSRREMRHVRIADGPLVAERRHSTLTGTISLREPRRSRSRSRRRSSIIGAASSDGYSTVIGDANSAEVAHRLSTSSTTQWPPASYATSDTYSTFIGDEDPFDDSRRVREGTLSVASSLRKSKSTSRSRQGHSFDGTSDYSITATCSPPPSFRT